MLVSHTYKFIYLKTRKTASTSVEGVLERYCTPPNHEPAHKQAELRSEYGYVSGRAGLETPKDFLSAHAPASDIRAKVGNEIFDSYRKIYCIRNPFDKVVSWFWHVMPKDVRDEVQDDFEASRKLFSTWLRMRPTLNVDRAYYRNGKNVFDAFRIRYEHLSDDMVKLLEELGIPPIAEEDMPQWKRHSRQHREHSIADYYDDETADIVRKEFAFDFRRFGYSTDLPSPEGKD